jgi:short-subunit dehydrogenase
MKKILITGASSGIGLALAREYASQYSNHDVVLGLIGRKLAALEDIARELEHYQIRLVLSMHWMFATVQHYKKPQPTL